MEILGIGVKKAGRKGDGGSGRMRKGIGGKRIEGTKEEEGKSEVGRLMLL